MSARAEKSIRGMGATSDSLEQIDKVRATRRAAVRGETSACGPEPSCDDIQVGVRDRTGQGFGLSE